MKEKTVEATQCYTSAPIDIFRSCSGFPIIKPLFIIDL